MATADFDSIYSSISDTYKSFQKALETKQEEYLSKGYKLTKDGNVDMRGTTNNPEVEKYKKETQAFFDKYREYLKEINEIQNENYESNLEQEEELFNIQKQHDIYKKLAEQQRSKTALDNAKKEYNARVLSNNKEYQDLVKQELDIFNLSKTNNKELTDEQIGNLAEIRKKRLDIENEINKKTADNLTNQVTESVNKWTEKGKTAGESIVKHFSEAFNKFSNYMLFDQLQSGINDLSNAYEQNFTSIAGYSGSDSRNTNHEFIKGVLEEVNANDYTKYGLNFNKEVFPEITNAVKEGFMGEEAQEIAISNAIDKKIMPWLDTSSETWTQLQFNLSDDKLQSIKGQQLLLQETREGNRLLQSGVIESIQNSLLPSMDNIVANTTEVDDLNEEMQQKYMYLTEDLGYSKQEAMKAINKEVEAYQNPYKALTSGDIGDKLLALDNLNGTDMMGSFARSMYGSGWVGSGAFAELTGIATGGETKTERSLYAYGGMEEGQKKYESTVGANLTDEQLKNIYQTKKSNLAENVTATQAHDNNLQNITAETVFGANNIAHGMDTVSLILDEVIAIKQWLIRSAGDKLAESFGNFLGNFLGNKVGGKTGGNVLGNIANTVGNKLGTGLMPGASKVAGAGKLGFMSGGTGALIGSTVGVTAGALIAKEGINTYKESAETLEDKTSNDIEIQNAKEGKALGGTAAVAGAAGGAAILALGASNPIGWAALAVGGAALAINKYRDHLAELDDATGRITESFDSSKEQIDQERKAREDQLLEIQDNIDKLDTTNEKLEYLSQNGINTTTLATELQGKNTEEVNDELQKYIDNLIRTNDEMSVESEELINDIAADFKNDFNDNVDQVKQALIDNYSTEALVARGITDPDKQWKEQKRLFEKLGMTDDEIERARTHFINGAMDTAELSDLFDSGAVDGKNIGSLEDRIEQDKVDASRVNLVLRDVGLDNLQLMDEKLIADALGSLADDIVYINRFQKYGTGEEKDNIPGDFSQEKYDTAKANILAAPEESKDLLTSAFNEIGAPNAMDAWPDSLKGFKAGTSFVPYDNMIAELHYGERVLTNPENKEYTENQLSGNNGISTIQIGLQDIVSAIQQQTSDIITYLQSMNSMSSMNGLSNLNMSATMGATRVVV